ncbi:MAG TPA: aminotransferase class I/II-fold pyridoxal phosphate-dependent enzyme [Candidatus Limnocylindrales bacterium]|nr:aminotransferase class I/II-fold pyridoxal phosphate-dependent enzyme [Candidatus Limnocylindrales bacterium]
MPGPGIELIGEEEIAEVMQVLRGRALSRYGSADDPAFGAKVRNVEREIAALAGVRYALGLHGGGSSGLWLSLMGLGIGPGDEVIVPGFTYVASISAIVYARALPVLAEVDDSFNLDPADVEARITPRTRAIIVVHMLGAAARLDELKDIADRHGIALIEDCAQAFGATYQGQGVGGIGAAGVYSFNEYKTITCGDGGMIVTDDEDLYNRLFAIHDQGHAPNRLSSKYAERPFLGMNFRMTELSGAVLLAQVRKLDMIRSHLRANKKIVKAAIEDLPGLGFRAIVDPEGDLATHLVVTFPSAEVAQAVAGELGSIPLAASGWHVYSNMEHLLEKRTVSGKGCPFDCSCFGHGKADYRAGMLPQTDALLARSMSIGIGVSDANLAPFGLRMRDDEAAARSVADRFREAAGKHLAG